VHLKTYDEAIRKQNKAQVTSECPLIKRIIITQLVMSDVELTSVTITRREGQVQLQSEE